jgi:hypothetical protein
MTAEASRLGCGCEIVVSGTPQSSGAGEGDALPGHRRPRPARRNSPPSAADRSPVRRQAMRPRPPEMAASLRVSASRPGVSVVVPGRCGRSPATLPLSCPLGRVRPHRGSRWRRPRGRYASRTDHARSAQRLGNRCSDGEAAEPQAAPTPVRPNRQPVRRPTAFHASREFVYVT